MSHRDPNIHLTFYPQSKFHRWGSKPRGKGWEEDWSSYNGATETIGETYLLEDTPGGILGLGGFLGSHLGSRVSRVLGIIHSIAGLALGSASGIRSLVLSGSGGIRGSLLRLLPLVAQEAPGLACLVLCGTGSLSRFVLCGSRGVGSGRLGVLGLASCVIRGLACFVLGRSCGVTGCALGVLVLGSCEVARFSCLVLGSPGSTLYNHTYKQHCSIPSGSRVLRNSVPNM